MPGIDGHHALHRFCDAVNLKRLGFRHRIRLRCNNGILCNFGEVDTLYGVLDRQFKLTIQHLIYFIVDNAGQDADAVAVKQLFVFGIQNKAHTVHHLGMISTRSISPDQLTGFSPARS